MNSNAIEGWFQDETREGTSSSGQKGSQRYSGSSTSSSDSDTRSESPFDRSLRLAMGLFGVPMAMVGIRDEDNRIAIRAIDGIGEESKSFAHILSRVVVRLGDTLVVEDVHRDVRFEGVPAAQETPIRFFAGVPLHEGDEIVGVLSILDRTPRRFEAEQMQQLEDLGQLAASAWAYQLEGKELQGEQLRQGQHEAWLSEVVDSAMDAIITIDEEQKVVRFNPAAGKLFRCAPEDALGRPIDDFVPEHVRTHHAEQVRQFGATDAEARWMGASGTVRGQRLDGEAFWAEASISKVQVKGQRYYTVILRDVTERQDAIQALQTSQAQYQLIVDTVQEVVFQVNAEGIWTYLNPAWTMLTGFEVEGSLGEPFLSYVHHTDRAATRDAFRSVVENGTGEFRREIRCLTQSGGFEWVDVHARTIQRADGTLLGVGGTLTCVTDRREREEELRKAKEEAEKMNRLKSAFLANMSHEIRTPLTAIIGFAELIDEDHEMAGRFAGSIRRSGQRLLRTLNSVLDLAQIESEQMAMDIGPVDVVAEAQTALEAVRTQAEKKGLALEMESDRASVYARADTRALERVLDNLISNALKFTECGRVAVRVMSRADEVVIEVEDTGIGVSDSFQREMFESFTQESMGNARTHEGSGLGLSIVAELVERMNGTIGVQSVPQQGTTFTVTLPAYRDAGVSRTAD